MKSFSALCVLRDQAQKSLESVMLQLAKLQQRRQQASNEQHLLQNYQADYQQILNLEAAQGIQQQRWENYHAFLQTVDQALSLQQQSVALLDAEQQQLLVSWQQKKQRVTALQTLLERQQAAEQRQAQRLQQKLSDEFANRHFRGPLL